RREAVPRYPGLRRRPQGGSATQARTRERRRARPGAAGKPVPRLVWGAQIHRAHHLAGRRLQVVGTDAVRIGGGVCEDRRRTEDVRTDGTRFPPAPRIWPPPPAVVHTAPPSGTSERAVLADQGRGVAFERIAPQRGRARSTRDPAREWHGEAADRSGPAAHDPPATAVGLHQPVGRARARPTPVAERWVAGNHGRPAGGVAG